MSATLITGLPRHGKSYFGMCQVVEELKRGKRYVVTNLPFNLAEVQAYLEEETGKPWDLRERLRILTPQETAEFWLYDCEGEIAKGVVLFEPNPRVWHKSLKPREGLRVPDFARRQESDYPGVFYVIDEAHIYFDAHAWQQIGTDCSFFISQHGHMRTDMMFITQHPAKLAKRLKLDLEEWSVITNLGRTKLWMGCTIKGQFMRETYPGSPDDPTPGQPERGYFRLDKKRLGKLYSTSAGVGLTGRVDTEEQARGRHWSWMVVGAGGILACCVLGSLVLLKGASWAIKGGIGGFLHQASGVSTNVVNKVAGAVSVGGVSNAPAVVAAANTNTFLQPRNRDPQLPAVRKVSESIVHCTGYAVGCVTLEDGRFYSQRDGFRCMRLPTGVQIEGVGFFPWIVRRPVDVASSGGAVHTGPAVPRPGVPRGSESIGPFQGQRNL